jgi:ketosteroid isomerase-like protein
LKSKMFLLAAMPLLVAAAPPSKSQILASAAPFIDRANDEWTRAIVIGDAGVMAAPYAADGVFIGPDGTAIRGRDAVRAMYATRRSDVRVLKASIKSEGRVAADADDVYEWGTALRTLKRGDTVRQASGRYLTVWRRDGNSWLISRNIAF